MPPSTVTVGKIHDYTRNLSPDQIREAVRQYVGTLGSDEPPLTVSPVWIAPAGDASTMTKAAREWRASELARDEFTEELKGRMYWFGICYEPRPALSAEDEDAGPDDEVPTQWPPEGEQAPPSGGSIVIDPRIVEQLGDELDEDVDA